MTVRWGLVSTARINERLIDPIRTVENSELVAVASRDMAKAKAYAEKWDIERAFGSYEAMLADPDVDAVYISLPNGYHCEWAVKSAEAGKHVLCEKPLALTVEEVDRMMAAARGNGVVMQEAVMYRFHPQTNQVRDLLQSGVIGSIRFLQAIFTFTLKATVDVRLEPDIGGGSLWDLGSYCVSFFRTMMGANPEAVSAWQIPSERGVDMSFSGNMHFATGAVAQFGCSFQASPHTEVHIVGSAGRMKLDLPWQNRPGEEGHVWIWREGEGGAESTFGDSTDAIQEEVLTFEGSNAYRHEVENMVAAIENRAAPGVPLEDSRGNVGTIVALYTAARENCLVPVEI